MSSKVGSISKNHATLFTNPFIFSTFMHLSFVLFQIVCRIKALATSITIEDERDVVFGSLHPLLTHVNLVVGVHGGGKRGGKITLCAFEWLQPFVPIQMLV